MAPVILRLGLDPSFECQVCVTAQHREMLDQVLRTFDISPDVDLNLMRPGQRLGELTARAVGALDAHLTRSKPDLVLVQGDTTTVLCAALASFYNNVPVGHVEAGLRTGDLMAPWPEEANRQLASRLASLHFAPTEKAKANLLAEGITPESIFITGNTVIDALLDARNRARRSPPNVPGLPDTLLEENGRLVLITGHRRESFGRGLETVCRAIADLARRFPDVSYIYPVHLNPKVLEPVRRELQGPGLGNVFLLEPLEYLPFVALMDRCTLVITDSGGIQEEAPALGKPVLVTRAVTERPEAVDKGAARLVGTDHAGIVNATSELLTDSRLYAEAARVRNIFGDGKAAHRIVDICREYRAQ